MKPFFETKLKPKEIFQEYENANSFKASLGDLGIFEQAKRNERFFVGDQWYGAQCGNSRPLTRDNFIKRIGEYKISTVGAAPVTVNYSAEGVAYTTETKTQTEKMMNGVISGETQFDSPIPDDTEISVITTALSKYQKTCAERLRFNLLVEQALRNAFISGTGIAYTYWDDSINTGLYADEGKTTKIKGDIAFEILDVENVSFGDPNCDDVQKQPFILIAQRLDVESVRREAEKNGMSVKDIVPDGATTYNAGDRGASEPTDSRRVTVITKLFKEWDENGDDFVVKAIKVTEKAVVRDVWDVGLTMYPIAVFSWERRRSSIYGDSEITYLIPNQIAVNRMITSSVWSGLSFGAPKMLVNNDVISPDTNVTNDPGQIIRINAGSEGSVANAVSYVNPPAWTAQYQASVNDLIQNTLNNSGANDAALGNLRPDNASAIIQTREAALQPMQIYQNRYYAFIEEIARIWADFWVNKYGTRKLKIETRNGTEYIEFNADRYKNLSLTARVDVGASTLWSEAVVISTLDSLLGAQIITPIQYLERLPKGIIPKLSELIDDMTKQNTQAQEMQGEQDSMMQQFAEQYPEQYAQFANLPPEQQQAMIQQITGGAMQ